MNKSELLIYIGSVEQIGGIRDFSFNEGKAKGVRAIEINTGKLCFTVLTDRCLDIAAPLTGNFSAISPAESRPAFSSSRISLRLGSDKALMVFWMPIEPAPFN